MSTDASVARAPGVVAPDSHLIKGQDAFRLRVTRPGIALGRANDTDFGGLGRIDHARLPSAPGSDRWLYVFRGDVSAGDQRATTHTAPTLPADHAAPEVTAVADTDLVLFLVDRSSPVSRDGTLSG